MPAVLSLQILRAVALHTVHVTGDVEPPSYLRHPFRRSPTFACRRADKRQRMRRLP
jgi:hypothetical protein